MFETIGKYLLNAAEKTPNIIKASFNKASESIDIFKNATESADTFGKYLANREKPKNNVAGYGQLPPPIHGYKDADNAASILANLQNM